MHFLIINYLIDFYVNFSIGIIILLNINNSNIELTIFFIGDIPTYFSQLIAKSKTLYHWQGL